MNAYRILVIDDDPSQHDALGFYLGKYGYTMLHALNGKTGIQAFEQERPDLVILDISLPDIDGFETLQALNKVPSLMDVPVLFCTSYDRADFKVQGFELGADDYITKPFNNSEMLARIRGALRRSKRYLSLNGTLEGDRSNISLTELLQTMDIGKKTAAIRIREINAEIIVVQGSFTNIRLGIFSQQQALKRILWKEYGTFSVEFNPNPQLIAHQTETLPMLPTLMSCITEVDEAKNILADIYNKTPILKMKNTSSDFPLLSQQQHMFPILLDDLIIMMTGDLKLNAQTIKNALANGVITIS